MWRVIAAAIALLSVLALVLYALLSSPTPSVTTDQAITLLALVFATLTPITSWLLARAKNSHDAQMAREARTDERRAELYVEVIKYLRLRRLAAQYRYSLARLPGDVSTYVAQSMNIADDIRARVTAFASKGVRDSLRALDRAEVAFNDQAIDLELYYRDHEPDNHADFEQWQILEKKREDVYTAITRVEDQCNADLNWN